MKTTIKILSLLAAVALTACEPKDEPTNILTEEITIHVGIQEQTKMNAPSKRRIQNNGLLSTFETGDQIQVYGWTGDKTTVPANPPIQAINTLQDNGDWQPDIQMLWQSQTAAHYFIGIYPVPAKPIGDFKADPYTLNLDDQVASDLLVAVSDDQGIVANNRGVDLTFKHMMAKIHVNLHLRTQVVDWKLEGVRYFGDKEATINYLTQQVNCGSYQYEPQKYFNLPALATPQSGYHASYETLVIPQTGVRRLDVRIAGYTYSYNGTEDIPLESGKITTVNLRVAKDNITLEGITVGDWHDGTDIEGGVAEEVPWVDLGLPTGTLWAAYNVGATAPEEAGDYFAWGETKPKSDYSWDTYKYGGYSTLTKYCTNGIYGTVDDKIILDVSDDAATANWGSDWRMPTKKEMEELAVECTWTWTKNYNSTGVAGYIVSSKAAGNTNAIFLPAASFRHATDEPSSIGSYGYYWCSSLDAENNEPSRAWNFTIYSGSNNDIESNNRYYGLSIRAVYVP